MYPEVDARRAGLVATSFATIDTGQAIPQLITLSKPSDNNLLLRESNDSADPLSQFRHSESMKVKMLRSAAEDRSPGVGPGRGSLWKARKQSTTVTGKR